VGWDLKALSGRKTGGLLLVEISWRHGVDGTRARVEEAAGAIAPGLIAETLAVQTEAQGDWLVCLVRPRPRRVPDPPDEDNEDDDLSDEVRLHTLDLTGQVPELDVEGDLDDLDNDTLRAFVGARAGAWNTWDREPDNVLGQALVDLGIGAPQGRTFAASVAALVAFGQLFACVEVRGDTGAPATRSVGPLPTLLRHLLARDALQGVPPMLLRELVVNALVHRDWSPATREAPVVVQRAGGVLEIVSPGTLQPSSSPRNPRLLRLVVKLGLATGQGRGLPRVRQALRSLGLPPPRVVASDGHVRVRLDLHAVRRPVAVPVPAATPVLPPPAPPRDAARLALPVATTPSPVPPPPPPRARVEAPAPDRLSAAARAEAVLKLLRTRDRPMTTREIVDALGWTRSTTRAVLASLVAAGRVRPVAESTRSRQQAYTSTD
jgi:hypothetical protein